MSAELIARIHARCVEEGDCLVWVGPVTHAGMPVVHHHCGKSKAMARRVLYEAFYGSVPEGKLVTPICGNKACLAKAHLNALTPKKSKAVAARKGAYKSRSASIARTLAQRARSHITEEMVNLIRDVDTARKAHELTGVSLQYCYEIRDGVARADLTSPFAGLGARQ